MKSPCVYLYSVGLKSTIWIRMKSPCVYLYSDGLKSPISLRSVSVFLYMLIEEIRLVKRSVMMQKRLWLFPPILLINLLNGAYVHGELVPT